MDNSANGLSRIDNSKLLDAIKQLDVSDAEKEALTLRIMSDDIDVRRSALEMISQSQIAQFDLTAALDTLNAQSKKGMYITTKQVIKTGSGTLEVQMKGGDAKLIIPVLIITGVIVIASLLIVFWK